MSSADKHIPARDMQFHRNASDLRAHRGEQDMHPDRALASERAADERTDNPHILPLESERLQHLGRGRFHQPACLPMLRRGLRRSAMWRLLATSATPAFLASSTECPRRSYA